MRHFLYRIILSKIIIAIICCWSVINLSIIYMHIAGPLNTKKEIIIKPGLSSKEIARKLKQNNIISNETSFWILSDLYGLSKSFKSGEYLFTPHISIAQINNILLEGKSIIHKIVIPEGVTVYEILQQVKKEPLLSGEIKAQNIPEGYLFPSTYFFSFNDKRQGLIDRMRNKMSATLDELMPLLASNSPIKDRKQALTLASIVEKEALLDKEKSIISGVYINRLKKKMRLQADPTVIYGMTVGRYKMNRLLVRSDLKRSNIYNTYRNYGLPPTAISCPGREAIKAAISPQKHSFLYFVANGKGGHKFSTTLRAHNNHRIRIKNQLRSKEVLNSK